MSDRGASAVADHNARVPADAQADVCRCLRCGPGPVYSGPHRPRGPVQDETQSLSLTDAAAMAAVEGRPLPDVLRGVGS